MQGDSEKALQYIRSGETLPWIENDYSYLTFSIKKGLDSKFIQELISRAGRKIINHLDPGPDADTALMAAARSLNSDVVFQLLKLGANPNLSSKFGYKPLYQAVCFGGMSAKLRGIIKRCDPEAQTSTQVRTYEVFHRSLPIIQALINHRASVNAKDSDGETALQSYVNQFFIDQVDPKIVTLLVQLGANPKDGVRKNPLSDKSDKKFPIDVILKPAIPKKTQDSTFQPSAFGCAIQKSNTKKALELLRSGEPFPYIENDYSNLILAIKKELSLELIQEFILQADQKIIDYMDPNGDTALMAAARLLNSDVVLQLLQTGADPNLCNKLGYTPLYLAVCFGDNAIPVRGPANRYHPDGMIPLYVRMHMIFLSSYPIIRALIRNRASVDAKDMFGKTPLQAYVNQSKVGRIDLKIVTLLVALGANPLNGIRLKFHSGFSSRIDESIRKGLTLKNSDASNNSDLLFKAISSGGRLYLS